jgi:hypothetical protein
MNSSFPAHMYVEKNGRKIPLCLKHARRELESGAQAGENISGNNISCEECQMDFSNR